MDISELLLYHRNEIINTWMEMLHTSVSANYSALPIEDIRKSTSRATDANYALIVNNDFSKIDSVIGWIGKIRSRAGFSLSEVQKAFELYRTVLLPILAAKLSPESLVPVMQRVNDCLAYTVHKFSDYFQALHEAEIRKYAQTLELMVEKRTKQLADSESKYRTLVEKIRDGYFVNQQGKMVFVNKAFCSMHGYTKKEIIGRSYTDFIAPQSLDEVRKIYEKRVTEGFSKEQYVYYRLTKDGSALPTENTVTLTFYQGRTAAIGVCRDITERVEIERRIRETERLAHIGQLTTSLAHEIRNPLSSAKMSIQMIMKNTSFEGADQRRLQILSQQISRLDRIVTEMLDFAKPVKYELRPVSVTELIDECLEVIEAKIGEKHITVNRTFSGRSPVLLADREKMEQAVINLLINAVDAVDLGGTISIEIKRGREKRTVEVIITDSGRGVSEEDLPFIFDPFFSKKTMGTGLGLANAKRVIEAHGATLQARRGKQGGMSFSILFPPSARANRTARTAT